MISISKSVYRYFPCLMLSLLFVISCGTEPELTETEIIEEPVVISGEWDLVGFEGEHVKQIYVLNGSIYISTLDEIYKSPISNLSNWDSLNVALILDESESIVDFEIFSGSEVFLGILDSNYVARTFKTQNGGESWQELFNELNENEVIINDIVVNPENEKLYLLNQGYTIAQSQDRGGSWIPIFWADENNKWSGGSSITRLILNPYDTGEIWAVGAGLTGQPTLTRTIDSGNNWTYYNLDTGIVGGGPVRDVLFSGTDDKVMVGFLGGIFTTTEPDGNWKQVYDEIGTLILESGNVTDKTVYASGKIPGIENNGKIFISFTSDFGLNWQRFYYQSAFTEAIEVNELAVVEVDSKETIFLATTKGLFSFAVSVNEPVE